MSNDSKRSDRTHKKIHIESPLGPQGENKLQTTTNTMKKLQTVKRLFVL